MGSNRRLGRIRITIRPRSGGDASIPTKIWHNRWRRRPFPPGSHEEAKLQGNQRRQQNEKTPSCPRHRLGDQKNLLVLANESVVVCLRDEETRKPPEHDGGRIADETLQDGTPERNVDALDPAEIAANLIGLARCEDHRVEKRSVVVRVAIATIVQRKNRDGERLGGLELVEINRSHTFRWKSTLEHVDKADAGFSGVGVLGANQDVARPSQVGLCGKKFNALKRETALLKVVGETAGLVCAVPKAVQKRCFVQL